MALVSDSLELVVSSAVVAFVVVDKVVRAVLEVIAVVVVVAIAADWLVVVIDMDKLLTFG